MNFKVGDKVIVIAGSNKGKEGKIKKTLRQENKVIIEGVNLIKKHKKASQNETGGILELEGPIHASNVMRLDPKTKKRVRSGKAVTEDHTKKVKISKKSNEKFD